MTNTVRIDIEVNDNAAAATTAGQRIAEPVRRAAEDIDRAFDKTSKQIGNSLDKIEQEAWKSGKGMDDAFGTAMAGLRRSLELAREEASQTGASLHSSVGQSLNEIRKDAERLASSMKPVAQAAPEVNRAWEKTTRLISVELDRVERDAWEAGRGTDKAFQTALADVRDDFERVRAAGKRTGASLESELGGSLLDVKKRMTQLREEAEKMKDVGDDGGSFADMFTGQLAGGGLDVGGMIEGLVGGAGGALGSAGAAAGALFADQAFKAMQGALEQNSIGGLIAAQNGGTIREGFRAGKIAGESFYDGFGDSVEQAGESLGAIVGRGLADLSDPQSKLENLTNMASTAVKVVGEDAGQISLAAKQLLVTDLAGNAEQAIDLIVGASQAGANASGDMIDTIVEYSTKFRDVGLNGQEAMGLISQAMKAGARDSDVAADAIKELSVRVTDGTAARGLSSIGLSAQGMRDAFAQGGSSAHEALRNILNGLNSIHDPAKRDQVALDLFGTKAEDLGDALYAMDLDTAAKQMGDFAGATDDAAKVISATESPMTKLGRGWDSFANDSIGVIYDNTIEAEHGMHRLGDSFSQSAEKANQAADSSRNYVQSLQEIVTAQETAANTFAAQEDASLNWIEAMQAADQAARDNGKSTDLMTEAGQNNRRALLELSDAAWRNVDSMTANSASAAEVQGYLAGARDKFVATAMAMGYSAEEANGLADRLHLIPGDYTARVHADTADAERKVRGFSSLLNSIQRTIYTNVTASINQVVKTVTGHAAGGIVGAETGGARVGATMVNEVGPELISLPSGSRVMTAGATRAMGEAGLLGGGGAMSITVGWDGPTSGLLYEFAKGLRLLIKNDHGGDVIAALGQ